MAKRQNADRARNGWGGHPLRAADLGPDLNDAGVTRPHLSRIVNVGNLVDAPPVESYPQSESLSVAEEEDVLIHEVRLVIPIHLHL